MTQSSLKRELNNMFSIIVTDFDIFPPRSELNNMFSTLLLDLARPSPLEGDPSKSLFLILESLEISKKVLIEVSNTLPLFISQLSGWCNTDDLHRTNEIITKLGN